MAKTSVLIVGLEPSLIDFSDPAYRAPGLNAALAVTVLRERLMKKAFVLVRAGLRLITQNTPLFERLVNVAHVDAPQAKLCFRIPPRRSSDVFLPRNSIDRHHDRALILF